MNNIKNARLLAAALVCLMIALVLASSISMMLHTAVEAQAQNRMANRSLRIGSTAPGETTDYQFSWRYPSSTNVRSVRLLFCQDAYVFDPCSVTPDGDFSAAVLSAQTGAVTGFSIDSQTVNEIVLTRATAAAGTGQSTYTFDNVINPSGLHMRFFVHVLTYPTADASGLPNYAAAVASAIAEPIVITTEVPPILYFCAAITVTEWCEHVSGNWIDYGDLSPFVTDVGSSQFGAATNAEGGYVVTVNGGTMTSGNKQIEALETPAPNLTGTAQFGINLRANTDPPLGQDVTGAGIGVVAAPYDTPDLFRFVDGDVVASAVTGTMFNTYTVTYIVNVPPDQPSGVYNTTIAYICTAAF